MYKICTKMYETFGNVRIKKRKFHHYKKPTLLEDQNADQILLSNKASSSKTKT